MQIYFRPLVFFSILVSLTQVGNCQQYEKNKKLNYALRAGWQTSELYWSIAGSKEGIDPNVLSELYWTKISGYFVNISLIGTLKHKYQWQISSGFGNTSKGMATDKDYANDNRSGNYYNETFLANNGGFSFLKLEIFQNFHKEKFNYSPKLGIGHQSKSFFLLPAKPEHKGVNSRYVANFWNVYSGFDCSMQSSKISFGIGVEPFAFYYAAKANWNLVNTFSHPVSFRQNTFGFGIGWHAKATHQISKSATLTVQFENSYAWGLSGIDKAYYPSGTQAITKLNQVKNPETRISIGITTNLY